MHARVAAPFRLPASQTPTPPHALPHMHTCVHGRVIGELMSLSRMASKFPDFDVEGKRLYLAQMEDAGGRYEVFMKRLELSQDPQAAEFLRATNAQMLEGGMTWPQMASAGAGRGVASRVAGSG
jgi:hypothetical protein